MENVIATLFDWRLVKCGLFFSLLPERFMYFIDKNLTDEYFNELIHFQSNA